MCGIAGIFNFNESIVDLRCLKKMTDAIIHRGPDGEGQWTNALGNVGFGHRRLSIIDLSENGKQPMHYANDRYTITYNGEIYNYLELKKNLLAKGYSFKSDSDTEVLMALYDFKKELCLEDLDGMFAFSIYDEKEQVLFCARDRFGEKPFHYFYNSKQFIFASEIKQFWALGIDKKLKQNKVLPFLKNGQIDNEINSTETFYENIFKLDAAHYISLRKDSTEIVQKRYWEIDSKHKIFEGTINEAANTFLELFTKSVNLRLRSDVPVGSSLSGGLDSSSIVVLIDELKGDHTTQNTFSARFKNFSKDEGDHIKTVVNACKNISPHEVWPDKNYFETVFNKVCFHQDEPFGSASIVAQYAVMELAKSKNITVLLDGQGADEYLAGYLPYYQTYLNSLFFNNRHKYKQELKAYNLLHNYAPPLNSFEKTETLRMKVGRYKLQLLNKEKPVKTNALFEKLKSDTIYSGLKTLLRYADRNSMAHSREVRLPFLSHKLVEFVFCLPDNYKLNNGWTKFVLRESMKNKLPESICWRIDKVGFEPPQNDSLNNSFFKEQISNAEKKYKDILPKYDAEHYTNSNQWKLIMAEKFFN